MLTEFFINDGFLGSPYFHDENLAITHDVFLNNWRNYGILITPSKLLPKYNEAIEKLPTKYKKFWKTAFAYGRVHPIEDDCADLSDMKDFDQAKTLLKYYSTAFTEETLSYCLCANNQLSRCCDVTNFEIVAAPVITASENIKRSIVACEKDIATGDNIDEIWAARFKNLAKYSKKIFISDRYLFERIIADTGKGILSTSISRFFEFLSESGSEFYISIGSDGGDDSSQFRTEINNYFEVLFKRKPKLRDCIKRLTLISNDKNIFQKHSHDRYIRFEQLVCEIGTGMVIFERTNISNTTMSIKSKQLTNSDEIEKALRLNPNWVEVIIS